MAYCQDQSSVRIALTLISISFIFTQGKKMQFAKYNRGNAMDPEIPIKEQAECITKYELNVKA